MKDNKIVTAIVAFSLGIVATCITIAYFFDINMLWKISTITNIIEDNSIYEYKVDKTDAASEAIALSVDDKYTRYFDKKSFKSYIDSISSGYIGIGAMLMVDNQSGEITISEVIEKSGAEMADMRIGDVILKVDDIVVTKETGEEVISYLSSKEIGDTINFDLLRNNKVINVDVVVDNVYINSVSSQMLDDGIGYIRIKDFSSSTDDAYDDTFDKFKNKLQNLEDQGLEKIIVDLRDNPGGDLEVVTKITDEFLNETTIMYMEYSNGEKEYIKATQGAIDIPVVVLVNSNSASASEVFTAALKDNNRCVVVGEKTYGKGVVQKLYRLYDDTGINVTVAKYFTPSGVCIDKIGIEPDFEIKLPDGKKIDDYDIYTDPQILKAKEILKTNF